MSYSIFYNILYKKYKMLNSRKDKTKVALHKKNFFTKDLMIMLKRKKLGS